jgi:maleate isomerase
MDVMAFGCTSASIVIGNDKIRELLTVNNPGIPATNPWMGALAAFAHLKARRVSIFSPYPTEVNYPLYQQLQTEGFAVPTIGALRIEKDTDITTVSFDSMLDGAKRILKQAPTDALFMSCTNLRALEHIETIEAEIGVPIVTSTQAMFWHAMTLAGKQPEIDGFGQLLAG